jgi:Late competence development protein ComFB
MEIFVLEEIELQLEKNIYHQQIAGNINISEVTTFALNRLPAHYASCVEGIQRQKNRIKTNRQLKHQISHVVASAFAAIERNPIRKATPIVDKQQNTFAEAKEVLPKMADILPEQEVKWIISFMETFLTNLKNEHVTHNEVVQLYYLLCYYWEENQSVYDIKD